MGFKGVEIYFSSKDVSAAPEIGNEIAKKTEDRWGEEDGGSTSTCRLEPNCSLAFSRWYPLRRRPATNIAKALPAVS